MKLITFIKEIKIMNAEYFIKKLMDASTTKDFLELLEEIERYTDSLLAKAEEINDPVTRSQTRSELAEYKVLQTHIRELFVNWDD